MSKAKAKGSAEERRIAKLIDGIPRWRAHRVPLSGAIAGMPGDVFLVAPDGKHFLIEAKRRKDGAGFKTLRRWKGRHDMLWLREDRQKGMVVVEENVFLMLLENYRRATGEE